MPINPIVPPVYVWKMLTRSGMSKTRKNEVMASAHPPRRSPGIPDTRPMTRAAAMATRRDRKRSGLTCTAMLPDTYAPTA